MFVRVSVVPLGESLYDGAISNMKSAIPRGGGDEAMHSISKLSGTPSHTYLHLSLWQGYSRDQPDNQVGCNVTFSTPEPLRVSVGSDAMSAYPLVRENVSLGILGRPAGNAST